ncbi:MAG: hypothetical protein MI976_09255 [Pseudomonadales bacterium]|nr:hypothetical protein [Pseudomonadales bacterium]
MNPKEILDVAESLRRQARKSINKFQTELDAEGGGLIDAMKNFGEGAIYGRLMLEFIEPVFRILEETENSSEVSNKVSQYLEERVEFLTGMKPWVPNSTDIMNNMINSITAIVIADLIESFKE